jgi:hypothetical protein
VTNESGRLYSLTIKKAIEKLKQLELYKTTTLRNQRQQTKIPNVPSQETSPSERTSSHHNSPTQASINAYNQKLPPSNFLPTPPKCPDPENANPLPHNTLRQFVPKSQGVGNSGNTQPKSTTRSQLTPSKLTTSAINAQLQPLPDSSPKPLDHANIETEMNSNRLPDAKRQNTPTALDALAVLLVQDAADLPAFSNAAARELSRTKSVPGSGRFFP